MPNYNQIIENDTLTKANTLDSILVLHASAVRQRHTPVPAIRTRVSEPALGAK